MRKPLNLAACGREPAARSEAAAPTIGIDLAAQLGANLRVIW
jgi:hypothetical protein